jgi:hypothetical protein
MFGFLAEVCAAAGGAAMKAQKAAISIPPPIEERLGILDPFPDDFLKEDHGRKRAAVEMDLGLTH